MDQIALGDHKSVDAVRSKQPRDFDPVNFTVVPPRRFQDLRVGDVFRAPTRATVHNQRGELVLEGEHQYVLKTSLLD
jgi:hypothetical protein